MLPVEHVDFGLFPPVRALKELWMHGNVPQSHMMVAVAGKQSVGVMV